MGRNSWTNHSHLTTPCLQVFLFCFYPDFCLNLFISLLYSQHQAAVKGMAWCPWQNRLLATGGGTNDRTVKFWNMNTGECVDSIDTKSQVSGIFWNTEYQEIITSHGFPNHTLQIWKYPSKNKVNSF